MPLTHSASPALVVLCSCLARISANAHMMEVGAYGNASLPLFIDYHRLVGLRDTCRGVLATCLPQGQVKVWACIHPLNRDQLKRRSAGPRLSLLRYPVDLDEATPTLASTRPRSSLAVPA